MPQGFSPPSTLDVILRWIQIAESLLFPIVLIILIFLIWRDFRRWVNHQIKKKEEENLSEEIKEFIE